MKICSACLQELQRESFSKKQWQLRQYQRRCKKCIANNRLAQLSAPSTKPLEVHDSCTHSTDDDEGPACYFCLENGPDGSGQPLMRDCSCRGDAAGFAHLSCLVRYAKDKSESAEAEDNGAENNTRIGSLFVEPWERCPTCEQMYCNELGLDLAAEFVAFAQENYSHNKPINLARALVVKLRTLYQFQANRKEAIEQIANQILYITNQLKAESSTPTDELQLLESMPYFCLGRIYLDEGTKESARIAIGHFERCRDLLEAVGDTDKVAMAESLMARARCEYEGRSEERIKKELEYLRTIYNQYVKRYGQDSWETLTAGHSYARSLFKARKLNEAEHLLKELLPSFHRVLGPDHQYTKYLEQDLQAIKFLNWLKRIEQNTTN